MLKIIAPGDKTWEKLDFHAGQGVEELLIVDPQEKTVAWLGLEGGEYRPRAPSRVTAVGGAELAERIDW